MTQWTEPEDIPEAVSLNIEFSEEIYIRWPELTASVRVDPSAVDDLAAVNAGRPDYKTSIQKLIDKQTPDQ